MNKKSVFDKNPALWMIIIVPVLAVVVGLSMLAVSVYTFDGPVVDDYYKKGKEINITLERDKVATSHQLFADITIEGESIRAALSAQANFQFPELIAIKFIHRTVSGQDRQVELTRQADGIYHGEFPPLGDSRWLVELGTESWRLTGGFVWPVQSDFELEAQQLSIQ